ncbi:MAG TPA: hypothetical protein VGR69_06555 [Candidatus Rubrimentiphilum sp.]|nr:hypothetical protein [Candidatus Rubrimentiphilum sp.]
MIKRLLAFGTIALFFAATFSTTIPARAGFCCAFNYTVTNRTSKGAKLTFWRNSILKSGHRITVEAWVGAGERVKVSLPEDKVWWKMNAAFKSAGESSRTIATADQDWYLQKNSSDRLVEENGRYEWAAGS